MSEGNSSEPSEKKKSESSSENWKSRAQKPKVDNRFKTEDVTNTKGLTFEDFALSADLQLALYELGYENHLQSRKKLFQWLFLAGISLPEPRTELARQELIPYPLWKKSILRKMKFKLSSWYQQENWPCRPVW
jgi:hypothetical protein